MRKVKEFSEENFIHSFVIDLKTRAFCFSDIAFSMKYIEEEIKPLINIVDFMFLHHFISEKGYLECKDIYEETISRGIEALKEKYKKEADENNKRYEQRKIELEDYTLNFITNHKVGDKVAIKGTLIGTKLPRYLEGGCLTIEGFTKKGNVKCRWDTDTVFSIPPCYLKDVNVSN